MADNDDRGQTDESGERQSIFDLFDPPPEPGPSSFGKIPVVRRDEIDLTDGAAGVEAKAAADAEAAGLQHWTAPATGQIPAVLNSERDDRMWADVKGPSWQGDDTEWAGPDLADVFGDTDRVGDDSAALALDDGSDDYLDPDYDPDDVEYDAAYRSTDEGGAGTAAPNGSSADSSALSEDTQIGHPPERPQPLAPAPERASTPPPAPSHGRPPAPAGRGQRPVAETAAGYDTGANAAATDPGGAPIDEPRARGAHDLDSDPRRPGGTGVIGYTDSPPSIDDIKFADAAYQSDAEDDEDLGFGRTGGRDIPKAIGVGVALAAVVLAAMWFGPYTTLALVVVLALLAVVELYNAMRLAGLRPATLLGIVGTVAAPAAAFYRGDAAFPLVLALAVIFGALWYLVGADTERPVLNLSLTILGVFWVGGLASFAGLMLRLDLGIQLLLSTIIVTVASDTMAYIGGRAYGSRPFHQASPNKTWEGTLTGFAGAVFAGFAMGVTDMGTLWDGNLVPAIALGAVVGVLAPIGDLAESVVKRDLGIKDMGTLLPGHGGVLDRMDGLLFALPGAYYLALVYGLI
jgi:CDP-diglyceride synthetase